MSELGAGHRWGRLNAALSVLLVAVLVLLVVVLVRGPSSQARAAEHAAERYDAVGAAAAKEIAAFLEVDYKNMDPLIDAVLDGATGKFAKQYRATRVNLKAAAQAARSISTGKVREVGVSDLTEDRATVFVAADAVVQNKSTRKVEATKACPHDGAVCRYYRLKITMKPTGDGWKMATLDFVS